MTLHNDRSRASQRIIVEFVGAAFKIAERNMHGARDPVEGPLIIATAIDQHGAGCIFRPK